MLCMDVYAVAVAVRYLFFYFFLLSRLHFYCYLSLSLSIVSLCLSLFRHLVAYGVTALNLMTAYILMTYIKVNSDDLNRIITERDGFVHLVVEAKRCSNKLVQFAHYTHT